MSRTIVITGGTSGIGLALKELFEKNGDTVLTFSIDEAANSNHYQGSVSHEIKVNQVFNDIHEKYGAIDMLINCAGYGMTAIHFYKKTNKHVFLHIAKTSLIISSGGLWSQTAPRPPLDPAYCAPRPPAPDPPDCNPSSQHNPVHFYHAG